MSERGVCICPECGCQFSDWQKVELEHQNRKYRRRSIRLDWIRRPRYRWRVRKIERALAGLKGRPLPPAAKSEGPRGL